MSRYAERLNDDVGAREEDKDKGPIPQTFYGRVLKVAFDSLLGVQRALWGLLKRDYYSGARLQARDDLRKIGSRNGGWIVPVRRLDNESVCYCVGVGEDITFDLGLIRTFGCEVFAYDPTPRAARHVKAHAHGNRKFKFSTCGLWDTDDVLQFYSPANPSHVSHSILNLQNSTTYFEARCQRLSSLMRENEHERLNLLKLDIEGAEYRVVESIIEDGVDIDIICVEYDEAHHPLDGGFKRRIRDSIRRLLRFEYSMVAFDGKCNYTFVKHS